MPDRSNDHATAHKGGEPGLQDLEEPEPLEVVIDGASSNDYPDGTSPSDYVNEWKRTKWRRRVFLAVSVLVTVVFILGVLGLRRRS
jgi:hypothetical protein